MKQKFLLAAIALFFFATTYAQVNKRQQNQRHRTAKGVKSGEITRHEAKRIHTQQKHVQHMETKAKSDGVVTKKEKAKLTVAQNHSSRSIARKKNNKRDRN